jgi:hypothetical protein
VEDLMKNSTILAAIALCGAAAFAYPAQAGEAEYGGTFCSHSRTTMVQANPDVTAFDLESWGIQTPDSTFKPWANATNHCTGNVIIVQGKATAHGECLWTDSDGDTFIGTFVDEPGKPGVWTFLGGTGKWKGVTGSGTYQYVSSSKPRPDGTGEGCTTHSGKYTLP